MKFSSASLRNPKACLKTARIDGRAVQRTAVNSSMVDHLMTSIQSPSLLLVRRVSIQVVGGRTSLIKTFFNKLHEVLQSDSARNTCT